MKISKAVVVCILTLPLSAFSSQAASTQDLKTQDLLKCAATFSYYTYLLKSIDYSNKGEIGHLEEKIALYISVAMAVAKSDTKAEYKEILIIEQNESERIIKSKGVNEYLEHTSNKMKECGKYTHQNKDRIHEAMSGRN